MIFSIFFIYVYNLSIKDYSLPVHVLAMDPASPGPLFPERVFAVGRDKGEREVGLSLEIIGSLRPWRTWLPR